MIDLGFKKSPRVGNLCMRDQCLVYFLNRSDYKDYVDIMSNNKAMEVVDPMHSINILNVCAYLQNNSRMAQMF